MALLLQPVASAPRCARLCMGRVGAARETDMDSDREKDRYGLTGRRTTRFTGWKREGDDQASVRRPATVLFTLG
jgi:hypothetical protein